MLPVSAKDTVPFVPWEYDLALAQVALTLATTDQQVKSANEHIAQVEGHIAAADGKIPTYHIRVPSGRGRAAWRRDVAMAGARLPAKAELFEALRSGVKAIGPSNLDELLAKLDLAEAIEAGKADPDADLAREISAFETQMMGDPGYSVLVAARTYWFEIAPLIAASHFLTGWENLDLPFARKGDRVPDDLLDALPQGHVQQIGLKAINLMSVSKDQEKNSASPSRSPAAPPLSIAAPSLPTAGADGISSASATPRTQA
jgi:hypothetical protein